MTIQELKRCMQTQINPDKDQILFADITITNYKIVQSFNTNTTIEVKIKDNYGNIYQNFIYSYINKPNLSIDKDFVFSIIFEEFQKWASFGVSNFNLGIFSLRDAYNCAKALKINRNCEYKNYL